MPWLCLPLARCHLCTMHSMYRDVFLDLTLTQTGFQDGHVEHRCR